MALFSKLTKSFGSQRILAKSEKYNTWHKVSKSTTSIPKFFGAYDQILTEVKNSEDDRFISILEQEKNVEEFNLINRLYNQALEMINASNDKNKRQMYLDVCFQYIKQSDDLFEPQSIQFAKKQFLFIDDQIIREGDI